MSNRGKDFSVTSIGWEEVYVEEGIERDTQLFWSFLCTKLPMKLGGWLLPWRTQIAGSSLALLQTE